MKIKHLSITAQNPQIAAKRLVELSGGVAKPFPSKTMDGAWLCVWDETENELVEFIPNAYRIEFGEHAAEYREQKQAQNFSASHIMIETDKRVEWLRGIAEKHCLAHRFRSRFGGPLYEVWIEDHLLIEFISAEIKLCCS